MKGFSELILPGTSLAKVRLEVKANIVLTQKRGVSADVQLKARQFERPEGSLTSPLIVSSDAGAQADRGPINSQGAIDHTMRFSRSICRCLVQSACYAGLAWQAAAAEVRYCETCDASAVAALTADLFAIGDDENSVIRIYSRRQPGAPLEQVDLTRFLAMRGRRGEVDVEGAARIGDMIYWISSHGTNSKGKKQQTRHRLFATRISANHDRPTLSPAGRPYDHLLQDLARQPDLVQFNLLGAAELAPTLPGGLNIEGLAATPEGGLLIGFRNPIPAGQALLVPLLNPQEVIAGLPPRFAPRVLLNLDGLGIRSIEEWRGRYYILAGSSSSQGESRLYEWTGSGAAPRWISGLSFAGMNPEAVAIFPAQSKIDLLVVSDDGREIIRGVECKKLRNESLKTFRAITVSLDSPWIAAPTNTPQDFPDWQISGVWKWAR